MWRVEREKRRRKITFIGICSLSCFCENFYLQTLNRWIVTKCKHIFFCAFALVSICHQISVFFFIPSSSFFLFYRKFVSPFGHELWCINKKSIYISWVIFVLHLFENTATLKATKHLIPCLIRFKWKLFVCSFSVACVFFILFSFYNHLPFDTADQSIIQWKMEKVAYHFNGIWHYSTNEINKTEQ